jgi:hypothetical protein
MKKRFILLALASVFVSIDAMAWGTVGHRTVGAIADQLIKGTPAQKEVAALLLPGESLEKIANWPDCVKGTYCGPQTPEMVEYTNANPQHSEYHYTDIPFQEAQYHDGAVGSADDDIVQTLKQAIAVLQGKDTEATNPHHFTKRQALILITHMTGDIHQPMHVGAAYVSKDGKFVDPKQASDIDGVTIFDTRGGNNLLMDDEALAKLSAQLIPAAAPEEGGAVAPAAQAAVAPAFKTKPFHSYWDSTVVDYALRRLSVRTPEQFAGKVIASKPAVAANTGDPASWPYQWADDTLAAAKLAFTDVTVGKMSEKTSSKGEKYTVFALNTPDNYPVPSSALARTQLIKGGYHLAALLQAIWPK